MANAIMLSESPPDDIAFERFTKVDIFEGEDAMKRVKEFIDKRRADPSYNGYAYAVEVVQL